MLFVPVETMMDESQLSRWEDMRDLLRSMENPQEDDPWLFHGTCQRSALAIDQNGFDPSTSWVSVPHDAGTRTCGCVFWTTSFFMADKFAQKHARTSDTFPAFFVARLSDVIRSGTPVGDFNTWAFDYDSDLEMKPANWLDSLRRIESIAVENCRIVPNLKVWSIVPLDTMPQPEIIDANLAVFYEQMNQHRSY